ncbi:biopolymer transport protein ExbD [Bradyrhizobium sp. USDA 4354]
MPASTAQPVPRPDRPLYLSLKEDLTLALGNDPVVREGLQAALDAAAQGNRDTRVFVRADKTVDYQHLMEVMNLLRGAGYLKIALVGIEMTSAPARFDIDVPGNAPKPSPRAP